MTSRTMYRIRSLAAAAATMAALAAPAAAQAGPLVADAPNCAAQTLSQPFLPWADVAQYTLAPGGSFEPGSKGWSLDGASVAGGNEPYNVTSEGDSRSLNIPGGASATSRSICVGLAHPDLRFFAKGSNATAVLNVEVLFEDSLGNVLSAPVGAVTGSSGWGLSAPMPVVANLLPLLPGSYTPVAFRFSASGGSFRIDDVYVDPIYR
ncbi:MAG: hypothetical protein ACJ76Z_09295 [Thermoleophilaceae bacterium]